MHKNKHLRTKSESAAYREFIKNYPVDDEGTTGFTQDINLRGSDEISDVPLTYDGPKPVRPSLKYVISDWIKKNWIGTIIVPLIIYLLFTSVQLQVEKARLSEDIAFTREELTKISDNYADKELIDTKLKLLKSEIENENSIDKAKIEQELEDIRHKINQLN